MAPYSHHLIQISIVEEYRIFRTINLDKNDDFVHSTKMYTFILLWVYFWIRRLVSSMFLVLSFF